MSAVRKLNDFWHNLPLVHRYALCFVRLEWISSNLDFGNVEKHSTHLQSLLSAMVLATQSGMSAAGRVKRIPQVPIIFLDEGGK